MRCDDESTAVEGAAKGRSERGEVAIGVRMDDFGTALHGLPDQRRGDDAKPVRRLEEFPHARPGDGERKGSWIRTHSSERSATKQIGREDLHLVSALGEAKGEMVHVFLDATDRRRESLCELHHAHRNPYRPPGTC